MGGIVEREVMKPERLQWPNFEADIFEVTEGSEMAKDQLRTPEVEMEI